MPRARTALAGAGTKAQLALPFDAIINTMDLPTTETFVVIAQNINLAVAHENIARVATQLDVHVDAVVETRKRLKTELSITVTGASPQVTDFRKNLGSRSLLGSLWTGLTSGGRW